MLLANKAFLNVEADENLAYARLSHLNVQPLARPHGATHPETLEGH